MSTGEVFPSHIGTGTKITMLCVVADPSSLHLRFHAQPTGAGNWLPASQSTAATGRSTRSRSLRRSSSTWSCGTGPTQSLITHRRRLVCTTGCGRERAARPEVAALPVAMQRTDIVEIFKVKGALEGEDLKQLKSLGYAGEADRRPTPLEQRSSDLVRDGKAGDRLVLEFPVETAGRYEVVAQSDQGHRLRYREDLGQRQPAAGVRSVQRWRGHRQTVVGEFRIAAWG